MNLKMIKYYRDCLKHAENPNHINYLKNMLEYFEGSIEKPVIIYGRVAEKPRP